MTVIVREPFTRDNKRDKILVFSGRRRERDIRGKVTGKHARDVFRLPKRVKLKTRTYAVLQTIRRSPETPAGNTRMKRIFYYKITPFGGHFFSLMLCDVRPLLTGFPNARVGVRFVKVSHTFCGWIPFRNGLGPKNGW